VENVQSAIRMAGRAAPPDYLSFSTLLR